MLSLQVSVENLWLKKLQNVLFSARIKKNISTRIHEIFWLNVFHMMLLSLPVIHMY